LEKLTACLLQQWGLMLTFVLVFHRILDFKTGLNFYSGPFFMPLSQGALSLSVCFSVFDTALAHP